MIRELAASLALALSLASIAACGGKSTGATEATPAASYVPIDPDGDAATVSEEVTFTAAGHSVPGTLVRPTAPGRHPALILMAGSGPTDRDWNSPLLPGKNGSAKLLAETLAKRGVIVLRFDKAATGANKASLSGVTFDIYRDEGRAALALLRARPDVAGDKLYVAGHSEGGIHATRVAIAEGPQIAGLLLLSMSSRSTFTLVISQLEQQLRARLPDRADAELAAIRSAFADFMAGKDIDPKQVTSIAPLQMLVGSLTNASTATLARSMFDWNPLPEVAKVGVHIFVYNGAKDVQMSPELDAKPLAKANAQAELFIAPDADHVLKNETRTLAELRADIGMVQANMNSESRVLDAPTVDAITSWLIAH